MNLTNYFTEIHSLLSSYQKILDEEILNFYPSSLEQYPNSWISSLANLSKQELLDVDNGVNYNLIEDKTLRTLLNSIKDIYEKVPTYAMESKSPLPPRTYMGIKEKKKHEIDTLRSFIPEICEKHNIKQIIDIGGGVGHLSRILSHHHQISTITIDRDSELQKTGRNRAKKYPIPKAAKEITFLKTDLGSNSSLPNSIKGKNSLLVGLHTCGPLANQLLTEVVNCPSFKAILNFGCCYLKLNGNSDINLSTHAKNIGGLTFSKYALTLATRSHAHLKTSEFDNKQRVKNYRYGLHLLMQEKLNIQEFVSTNNVSLKIYNGSFPNYVLKMLKRMDIKHTFSEDDIHRFYESINRQTLLNKMFMATIIRWQFGKIIELYILVDRAIYLQENGMDVTLATYFNPLLSPRNIGIFGIKGQSTK